jgi:hypothetical protein
MLAQLFQGTAASSKAHPLVLESLGNAHPHQCRRRLVKWHGEISRHGNNSKLLTPDVDTAINEEHDG